jgi:hypothetical protein
VVENATPGTVWDRDLKGYGVRISPKGVRACFVHHRLPGGRQLLGAAACGWLALASASMAGAGEPIILTPDMLDAITAGSAGAAVDATSLALGPSGTLAATSATTSTSSAQVSQASGDGEALAVAPVFAGTNITNTAGTDNGSSGALVVTQTTSVAIGDAIATSGSRTRAIGTPAANIAIGYGYASATGDWTAVDASTSLYGYGDIVVGHTNDHTSPDGSTVRSNGVIVAVSPPGK